jgi:titin
VAFSGSGNTVGGAAAGAGNVIGGNGQDGVFVDRDADNNLVQGNRIGTDAAGAADLGNKRDGVRVANAVGTVIGGAAAGAGNLISGNDGNGVNLLGALTSANRVEGNLIGTDAAGAARLPNTLDGIALVFASGNMIGGEAAGARNVISGNDGNGVSLSGFRATGNSVAGNLIGTNAAGTATLENGGDGVLILNAQDNRVGGTTPAARNVISGNRKSGVAMRGLATDLPSRNNRVEGNFIGTDATGTAPVPNVSHGIELGAAAVANVVGGTAAGARNIISGNHVDGISFAGGAAPALVNSGNAVHGNFVGTDVSGAVGIANGRNGISLFENADDNTVGGTTAAARNVISGNLHNGVALFGTRGNVIQGNFIGADAAGTGPLPNAEGVFIQGSSNTLVGGLTPASGNLIAFNGAPGTPFDHGVGIYTFGDGVAVNNAVRLNSIFANGGMGIDLADNRVTANDAADADAGENNRQNFPILTSAATSAAGTAVSGVLNSTPNTTFFIDFYANSPADSAVGATAQGRSYLGTVTVTTDAGGNAAFNPTFATALGGGSSVTATATTINESPFGNTSEFSAPVSLPAGPAVVEVYVRGSAWAGPDADAANLTFKEFLQVKGLGDAVFGFRADTLVPTATLPWINLDEVVLRFAGPLGAADMPQPGAITLRGDRAGGDYAVQSVTQLDARTVVLRLNRFLGQLVGGGEDGVRVAMSVPGAGAGGSSFALRLNVLQGDVDQGGSVLAGDFSAVKKKFFKSTNGVAAGNDADYSPFHDVDASGTILANDFSEVKKRFFDTLPPVESPTPVGSVRPAEITRTLFGIAPIV